MKLDSINISKIPGLHARYFAESKDLYLWLGGDLMIW